MGSPSFGLTGNNAPPPTFGPFTNPTGSQNKGFSSGGSFPNFPVFGTPSNSSYVTPMANGGGFTGSDFSSLFSNPLSNYYNNTSFWNSVGKAYGKGTGNALETLFGQMFNPNTVAAYLNSMQPAVNRGTASLQNSFAGEGSRFGSAASLGIGDYLSQVNLNEQQTVAGMYENAVNQEANIITGMMPTLHAEQANKGGWKDDVIGGLEIAGSIAADVATGGAAIPLTAGITAQGISTLGKGITGNGGGGGGSFAPAPMFGLPGMGGNTGIFGPNAPSYGSWMGSTNGVPNSLANNPYWNMGNQADIMQVGGGSTLGGSDFDFSDPNNPLFGTLQ